MNNILLLNRFAFGPNPATLDIVDRHREKNWLEEQLAPKLQDDPECQNKLSSFKLRIHYEDSADWKAVDEIRSFQYLDAPISELIQLNQPGKKLSGPEKNRPLMEVTSATLIRAVYSHWQVHEVMCDFWHNHFNVNAWDHNVGIGLPVYDRDVIRKYALGNFRELVEAVAKSYCMQTYLNNRSSRAGAPNENYARELLELHTLGKNAYLNNLYNKWRDVPGAKQGHPDGFIDQDVYEAARAFTGWSIEDGANISGKVSLPRTGRFVYVESWHDNYQKRVLANEIEPYQPALSDGNKVLDLAAFHTATAEHLCKKLCVRFIGDQPPKSIVESSAKVWREAQNKPDQIARVLRHIAESKEFQGSGGDKVKRPLELVVSYLRGTGIEFSPTEGLIHEFTAAGQKPFGWPAPNGYPDKSEYWLSNNTMRRRWSLVYGLTMNTWKTGGFDPFHSIYPPNITTERFTDSWITELMQLPNSSLQRAILNNIGIKPDSILKNPDLARRIVAWIGMSPSYQVS